jgi:predicted metal-dependent hydrolase
MSNFINTIILTILIISIFIYYESKYSELTYVKSEIDGKEYLVRNLDDKVKGANTLSKLKDKMMKLINISLKTHPKDKRVLRLKKKFNPNRIRESISNTDYTSYSVNKGEKIVFCIRQKNQELIHLNTLLFVAIHEMAHIMTISIGHTDEFWNNMKFLLKIAIKNKIYKKQYFNKKPVKYCGTKITNSPLD